ncbi:MAG: AAA family ATPase [Erysipelotrichaceae bacterium]|nr:AAA family ATPase [Erysipelotrichaceae bacterium]
MSRKWLREKIIEQMTLLQIGNELKYYTPALFMAAAIRVIQNSDDRIIFESEEEEDRYLDERKKLRKLLYDRYVDPYVGENTSIKQTRQHFFTVGDGLLLMAKEKDTPEMQTAYKTAVVRSNTDGEGSIDELFAMMLKFDKDLCDLDILDTYLVKAKETRGNRVSATELFEKEEKPDIGKITAIGMGLAQALKEKVFGQDAAINEFVEGYMQYLMGHQSKESRQPAVFMFAGPSGTGKSSLAKAIRNELHCAFMQFDMTQYSDH